MNQRGFVNIAFIFVVGILSMTVRCFALTNESAQPDTTQLSSAGTEQASTASKYPYILPFSPGLSSYFRSELIHDEICRIEITDEASIVEMVKNWLVQNSKFTGVTNKSDLVVDRVVGLEGCIKCEPPDSVGDMKVIELKIEFQGQTYNGLPVEGDTERLAVFANVKGIARIDGYGFLKIKAPLEPKISENSAKNKLVGRIFTFSDKGGRPRDVKVEQEDLDKDAHKVIFVKKRYHQGLELRLAWKITVKSGRWLVYIDALTGEELEVVQAFQT